MRDIHDKTSWIFILALAVLVALIIWTLASWNPNSPDLSVKWVELDYHDPTSKDTYRQEVPCIWARHWNGPEMVTCMPELVRPVDE